MDSVDPTSVIRGTVTESKTRKPIERVDVQVTSPDGNLAEVYTDASGKYRTSGLPAGLYTVRMLKSGYEEYVRRHVVVPTVGPLDAALKPEN